jgi:hypothetical protein
MKMQFIKIPADGISLSDLCNRLDSVQPGYKFVLKIKKGRRFKLRKYRVDYHDYRHCECCGDYHVLSFQNSTRWIRLDGHFGGRYVMPGAVL